MNTHAEQNLKVLDIRKLLQLMLLCWEKFSYSLYANGSLLRVLLETNDSKLERMWSSDDENFIALTLRLTHQKHILIILHKKVNGVRNTAQQEKRRVRHFYKELINLCNCDYVPQLQDSLVYSFDGKFDLVFDTRNGLTNMIIALSSTGNLMIWSQSTIDRKLKWELIVSCSIGASTILEGTLAARLSSSSKTDRLFWLESNPKAVLTPLNTVEEVIGLSSISYEIENNKKLFKPSATTIHFETSRNERRHFLFVGGMWTVPTRVSTSCEVSIYVNSIGRAMSVDLHCFNISDEATAVSALGILNTPQQSNLYILVADHLFRVHYKANHTLSYETFLHDSSMVLLRNPRVILESQFGVVFAGISNNSEVVTCRFILHEESRSHAIIEKISHVIDCSSEPPDIYPGGIVQTLDFRGYNVLIKSFFVWNGLQEVNKITPCSPQLWGDIESILSVS